jgi:hypothetical protein
VKVKSPSVDSFFLFYAKHSFAVGYNYAIGIATIGGVFFASKYKEELRMTDEKFLEMMTDPATLMEVVWLMTNMHDFDELVKEHGEQTLMRLACEAIEVKRNG